MRRVVFPLTKRILVSWWSFSFSSWPAFSLLGPPDILALSFFSLFVFCSSPITTRRSPGINPFRSPHTGADCGYHQEVDSSSFLLPFDVLSESLLTFVLHNFAASSSLLKLVVTFMNSHVIRLVSAQFHGVRKDNASSPWCLPGPERASSSQRRSMVHFALPCIASSHVPLFSRS